MDAPILVTGALGNVGAEVVALLRGAGQPVRAAGRGVEAIRRRFGAAVDAVRLDFDVPATFAPAFAGVQRVFLMRPPALSDVRRSLIPAIDAAARAGVQQIVFLSLIDVQRNTIVPHYQVEQHLQASGLRYTLLRSGFFMQNLSGTHRDDIRDADEIFVPAGRGATSFVDVRDVAAVAALALRAGGDASAIYELTGEQALSYDEVADQLSGILGRRIVYRRPALLPFIARQLARGRPWPAVLVMAGIYTSARLGLAARVTGDVRRLLGRPPITFQQFAADYAACWWPARRGGVCPSLQVPA